MDEAEIARLMSLLALTEANRRSQEEQQKLESIRNEMAGLRQASTEDEHRQKSLHQCPACGGRLDGEFRKCKHCASDLVWIDGHVCEPGQEEALRQRLAAALSPQPAMDMRILTGFSQQPPTEPLNYEAVLKQIQAEPFNYTYLVISVGIGLGMGIVVFVGCPAVLGW